MITTVFFLNITDHFVTAVLTKINIEIRHGDTVRVEEPFEQQSETKRVEVGDGQRPGNHRTGTGPASRADRNAVFLGPMDEVGNDQEVSLISHVIDDLEFVLKTFSVRRSGVLLFISSHVGTEHLGCDSAFQTGFRLGGEFFFLAAVCATVVRRQDWGARFSHERSALGDDQGIIRGFR